MTMVGKTERRMIVDRRDRFPGRPDRFSASHGTVGKSGNVENRALDFVNKKIKGGPKRMKEHEQRTSRLEKISIFSV